jgi:peptidoglycan hydrolase-like protein with peptidoglycan-binding domain
MEQNMSKNSGGVGNSGGSNRSNSPKSTNGVTKNGSLTTGAKGPKVASLQRQLSAAGFKVQATGTFGAKTKAALEGFQAKAKLKADGFAGKTTLNALNGAKPASAKPASPKPAAQGVGAPKGAIGKNRTATLGKVGPNHSYKGGTITINGHKYTFNSGGSIPAGKSKPAPSLPPGSYTITKNMGLTKEQLKHKTMIVGGVGFKYGMTNKFDPRVNVMRTALRIHPDGRNPGTEGCIGIVGGASVQKSFQRDIEAELKNGGGSFNLNVGQ